MLHRNGGDFDLNTALDELIAKYGVEEKVEADSSSASPSAKKKRKIKESSEEESPKKLKTEIVAVEKNRPFAEAIKEIADIYFKHKDMRKGSK
jgi:hypothetical protein